MKGATGATGLALATGTGIDIGTGLVFVDGGRGAYTTFVLVLTLLCLVFRFIKLFLQRLGI